MNPRMQKLVGNLIENNKEELALSSIKMFRKQFNVRILERQDFKGDEVIDYIVLREVCTDASSLEELEDKNWFDEDNQMAKSGTVVSSLLELPDSSTHTKSLAKSKKGSNHESGTEVISTLAQVSIAREEELFNYKNQKKLKAHAGSLLCLLAALLVIAILTIHVIKAVMHTRKYDNYLEWTKYLTKIRNIELNLNNIALVAMKLENKASSYMGQDFKNTTMDQYREFLNTSGLNLYHSFMDARTFGSKSGLTGSLLSIDAYYMDANGDVTIETEILPIAIKNIISSTVLLVTLCLNLATFRRFEPRRSYRKIRQSQPGSTLDILSQDKHL